MNCPNCGTELLPLAALLARTATGTQCPRCWTRLRAERRSSVFARRRNSRQREPLRRAA
jgi:hypothetical protein